MPLKPRFYLSDVPVHIVQRGHSRGPVFYDAQDYATYAYSYLFKTTGPNVLVETQ